MFVVYEGSMSTPCFDTVLLSDLHLGSEVSRAKAALQMLKSTTFSRLILLGDIFCDLNFRRLKKEHWQLLGYIRKLSNPKRGIEVVWVEGNHDLGLSDVMSHLVGIPVYQQYEWDFRGRRHLAIHGHQFDRFLARNRLIPTLFTLFHEHLQKIPFARKRVVGFLERFDTVWLRLSDKVAREALRYARERGADRVFCGHTHEAMQVTQDGVEYFNTGSWTQANATFVTVHEDGVKTHAYIEPVDDRDRSEEPDLVAADVADLVGTPGL